MPDTSNDLAITNSTTVNFVVIDSVASSSNSSNSQTLSPTLKQLKTTTGADSIAVNTTASVALNDTYIDPTTGQQEPSLLYRLVFSTTDWLTPVAIKGVMQDLVTELYNPVTVLEATRQAMQSALKFVIMTTTYPTSALAQKYNSAVNASMNQAGQSAAGQSTDTITKGVDDFFKSTTDYSAVTFDMVMAINSYFDSFPFAWARYQNTMTYYLYSSDGTNPTKYEGQLNMTRSGSGIPNIADSNGGYTIVHTDANGKNTTLTYTNGQFVDDPHADIPNICLQGTFTLKSRLTSQPSDNQVMTILSGSVGGMTVLGLDTKQQRDSNQRSYWQTLFEPQGAQEIISSILTISGVLFTLHFIGSGLWSLGQKVRRAVTGKKPLSLEDTIRKVIREEQSKVVDEQRSSLRKLTANKEAPPRDTATAERTIRTNTEKISAYGEKTVVQEGLESAATRLETLVEASSDGVTLGLKKAALQLRDSETALKNSTPDTVAKVVEAEGSQLSNIQKTITQEQVKMESELGTQVKQQLEAQAKESASIEEDLTKMGEESTTVKEGSMPEGDNAPELPEVPEVAI